MTRAYVRYKERLVGDIAVINVEKVNRAALYRQVVDQLQQIIVERRLQDGDQLPGERELCEQFGVSRTVIREALRALAQMGVLTIIPGRGTFVSASNKENVSLAIELFAITTDLPVAKVVEVRRALEPEIAALAALRATADHLERLERCIDEMEESLDDPLAFVTADEEFHHTLAQATGNPLFIALTGVMVNMVQSVRLRVFDVDDAPARGQKYHRLILKCVAEGNSRAAREAMVAHLSQVDEDALVAEPPAESSTNQTSKIENATDG